jgi:hypothetical protein
MQYLRQRRMCKELKYFFPFVLNFSFFLISVFLRVYSVLSLVLPYAIALFSFCILFFSCPLSLLLFFLKFLFYLSIIRPFWVPSLTVNLIIFLLLMISDFLNLVGVTLTWHGST